MNIALTTPWYHRTHFGITDATPSRILDAITERLKNLSKAARRRSPDFRPSKRPSKQKTDIAALVASAEKVLKADGPAVAEPLFRTIVEAITRSHVDAPLTALRAYAGFAHCLDECGNKADAICQYENANRLIKSHGVGLNWTTAACVLNNLAILYRGMGRYAEAEACLVSVINELEHTLRVPDSEAVLTTLYEALGNLYHLTGHPEAAEEMQKKALVMQEKGLGVSPERRFESLKTLASLRLSSGHPKEAAHTFRMALASLDDVQEPNDKWAVEALLGLGLACNASAQSNEAIQPLKQALQVLSERVKGEDLLKVHVLGALGNAFMATGRAADAYMVFSEADRITSSSMVAEDTLRLETVANLASACESLGRLTESASLRDRSVELGEMAVRDIHEKVRAVVLPVLKDGNRPKPGRTMVAAPIARVFGSGSKSDAQSIRSLPLRTETLEMEALLDEGFPALSAGDSGNAVRTPVSDSRGWKSSPGSRTPMGHDSSSVLSA